MNAIGDQPVIEPSQSGIAGSQCRQIGLISGRTEPGEHAPHLLRQREQKQKQTRNRKP